MTSPTCGAHVTNSLGSRVAGPCVLPLHHGFFHLWVDAREYSWHWNGPWAQAMGDPSSSQPPVRIVIYPPGWLVGDGSSSATDRVHARMT